MKQISVYFNGIFVHCLKCDKILPDQGSNSWLVYSDDKLIGAIPMTYLLLKDEGVII